MSGSILYLVSRYPKVTETFVVNELLAIGRRFEVRLAPLLRTRERVVQPEAKALRGIVWFASIASMATARAHLHWLAREPRAYIRTLGDLVLDARRPTELFQSCGVFIKAVRLASMSASSRIGHVHAHFANHPATAAWIVHRLTGMPFSFTAHANDLFRRPAVLNSKLADAQFIAAVSEYNATLIRQLCPGARVHVVHCGVDVERFQPRVREHGTAELLCVASLEPRKGHRYLLEAVAALTPRHPDLRLVLIGEGPERAKIEQLAKSLGLAERAYTSAVPVRPIVSLRNSPAPTCSYSPPSAIRLGVWREFPVALMEAMAAGVPVVATRLSGIPELVDFDTGMLVEPNDPDALASAIERLLDDPTLARRCADRGRARVVHDFDLFTEARRLGDLFERSLSTA